MYTRFVGNDGNPGNSNIPLSCRKGVTCSQFVMYCYQIANLAVITQGQTLDSALGVSPETLAGWLGHKAISGEDP